MGRRGTGPGEFSDNSSIQLHRWTDTLLATDDARVHAYTEALDSARTRPYDFTSGAATGSFAKSLLTLEGRPCCATACRSCNGTINKRVLYKYHDSHERASGRATCIRCLSTQAGRGCDGAQTGTTKRDTQRCSRAISHSPSSPRSTPH